MYFNVRVHMELSGILRILITSSAIHRPSGQKVAIKKIAPFDHSMFCLRTLRELKLLKYFQEQNVSENVSSLLISDYCNY